MNPSIQLRQAEREEIDRRKWHTAAKAIAIAVFIGLCLIPFVLPIQ